MEHVQAIIKIFSQRFVCERLAGSPIGSSDYSHIDGQFYPSAQPAHVRIFQHPK